MNVLSHIKRAAIVSGATKNIDDFVFAEMKMIRVAKNETYNHKTPHDTRRMPQTCSGFYCLLSKQQNISIGRPK